MVLAQGIEMVINNADIAVYLVAIITLWELARYILRRLYKWLWGRKVVVIPASATLYTTVGGNCMHARSDCDVLRYSQPRAKTLCKHCVKKGWVVNAEFLGDSLVRNRPLEHRPFQCEVKKSSMVKRIRPMC